METETRSAVCLLRQRRSPEVQSPSSVIARRQHVGAEAISRQRTLMASAEILHSGARNLAAGLHPLWS